MEVIMRPVFNRPELLYLSLEYEYAARDHRALSSDLTTLFIVEHGSTAMTIELVNSYPFPKKIIKREKKLGLSVNILCGLKEAFSMADNFVIHIEDDVLLHKTYFDYMNILLAMCADVPYSILSPFNENDDGDVNDIYAGHHYAALAPLIDKEFFTDYVEPCITPVYYENFATRDRFVRTLDNKYQDDDLYKYKDKHGIHNQQAGLLNRLVDIALITENKHVIMPCVNRQQHIGMYGHNRGMKVVPGGTFEQKIDTVRGLIRNAKKMYAFTPAKIYNDYRVFDPRLEEWERFLNVRTP